MRWLFLINKMTKAELKQILDTMLIEGEKARKEGEIPISAALVLPSKEVIYTHNEVEKENNPFSHAEIKALEEGMKKTHSRYLKDSILIVSLEPCLMCLGAILKAGVKTLYYVLDDKRLGGISAYHTFLGDKIEVVTLEDERFKKQLDSFFSSLRDKEKK